MKDLLSVIIPAYNEQEMIPITVRTVSKILEDNNIPFELVFINDGSKDNTWPEIMEASQSNSHVCGVCFSRNFGKESAIMAGLSQAKGDCAVVIDCDLQHPPIKIVEMYDLWKNGYEIVEGVKSSQGEESKAHAEAAHLFYRAVSKASGFEMENQSDFKLLDRKAINTLLNIPERSAFFRALSNWIGYKSTTVEFDVEERATGQSKWSTKALVKYALSNISSFSTAPMQIVTVLGVITLIVSIIFGITALVQKLMGIASPGFTTVILILLFIGSLIMISLGIIGFYITKIYEEVKGRPRYIISTTCGQSEEENA